MRTQQVLSSIFDIAAPIRKAQRRFLTALFVTVFAMRGRLTFTNMARYSPLHEHTFRRHFAKEVDWLGFNQAVITLAEITDTKGRYRVPCIGVFDCSFLTKSGKHTYGLDRFWSSCHNQSRKGLEISLLGVIAIETKQTFALDVVQTPAKLSTDEVACYSRIDFYMEQFRDGLDALGEVVYMVADGNYARTKVFQAVEQAGKHLITRLRSDANLRYLYQGPPRSGQPGRPARYAGKVDWHDLSRFDYVGRLADQAHIALYTKVLNSPRYKRDFRVVVLLNTKTNKYVVLASSDTKQSAEEVVAYYRLRFQVEFLFRDAKQFTGLEHCQARDKAKLDFHFNMSLAAVNVARLEMHETGESFNSFIRGQYNRFLVREVLMQLGLEAHYDETHPALKQVIDIGRMAA